MSGGVPPNNALDSANHIPAGHLTRRKVLLLGCGATVLISIVGVIALRLIMSDATPYCPWQHHISDLSSCEVLDKRDGRVLLQHADLDTNIYYLEIVEDLGQRRVFQLPDQVRQLAPNGYSAQLLSGSSDHIVLNGSPIKLVALR